LGLIKIVLNGYCYTHKFTVKEGKDKQLQQTSKWKWPFYGQGTVSWDFE